MKTRFPALGRPARRAGSRRRAILALAAAAVCLLPAAALAQEGGEPPEDGSQTLPSPVVLTPPAAEVRSEVFLISDNAGWGDREQQIAERLRSAGVIVVGIDLPSYLRRLEALDEECLYLVSDIEAVSHRVQRELGNADYESPIVAGVGAGGALALAIAAQTPDATIDATVAVDPADAIALKRPLCTPAERADVADGTRYALTPGPLPNDVTAILTPAAPDLGRAHVTKLRLRWPEIVIRNTRAEPYAALEAALTPPKDQAVDPASRLARLPLAILDAQADDGRMAIIYSGDGGWRDIDMVLGEELQQAGIPVVGVDALRYFWTRKTPQSTAADLQLIMDAYTKRWKAPKVILVGYSFGADILPSTFDALDPAHRAMVSQISLLSFSPHATYQISVAGWLGVSGGDRSTLDDLKGIDLRMVQCFYGRDDDDTACPKLKDTPAEVIETAGGHHFDGNYPALAAKIEAGPAGR